MKSDVRKGLYIPELTEECNNCGICIDTCPGNSNDLAKLSLEIFGEEPKNILLGNYINCYLAHAVDPGIRYKAASGGLVTSLLTFALEHRFIDGALVTRMSRESPLQPEPYIARTKEDLLQALGSKYCPVPVNIILKEILNTDGKYAVVGLPCHIHGVRKAEAVDKILRDRIKLHFGIFCSHTVSFWGTEFLLSKLGVNRKDVEAISYRGEGWPGGVTIKLKNGSLRFIPNQAGSLWDIVFSSFLFTPSCCLSCTDLTNELADISFGDAWLPEIVASDRIGTSVVITRSERGEALLRTAASKGAVELTALDAKDVTRSQEVFLHFKKLNLKGTPNPLASPYSDFITRLIEKMDSQDAQIKDLTLSLKDLEDKDRNAIKSLETDLQQKSAHIRSLESNLQQKSAQITSLESDLQQKSAHISSLEIQIQQINHGIVMQLLSRYQRVVNKLLPLGSRRRNCYELGLSAIRIIINEGWGRFWSIAKDRLRKKKMEGLNILILNAHWSNRGDEAAVKAMIDSLRESLPFAKMKIMIVGLRVEQFPYVDIENIRLYPFFRSWLDRLDALVGLLTLGRISLTKRGKAFIQAVREADIVIHGPGGPTIGDVNPTGDLHYLYRLLVARVFWRKPLFFYAPSMGPFSGRLKNWLRKFVLRRAEVIILREKISQDYLKEQLGLESYVTLDSAFQNDIPEDYLLKYDNLSEMLQLIERGKTVGLVVTELTWYPFLRHIEGLPDKIFACSSSLSRYLVQKGYNIILIHQLFGEIEDWDFNLLERIREIDKERILICPKNVDAYGQQVLISKLFCVISMRYHPIVFAAKGNIPFICIYYEHKAKAFAERIGLADFSMPIEELNADEIMNMFATLERDRDQIKGLLSTITPSLKEESRRTTRIIVNKLAQLGLVRAKPTDEIRRSSFR
jgi:coenzyme F420 hydrogenase subunit beta